MRFVHLSDLHVSSKNAKELEDQSLTLQKIVYDANEREPDCWLLTGDFYGHTVPHRSTPEERQVLFPIIKFMAGRAPVVIVQGNHDHTEDILILEHLSDQWPVHVFTAAQSLEIPTPSGVFQLYALPYVDKKWVLRNEKKLSSVKETQRVVENKIAQLFKLWSYSSQQVVGIPKIFAGHILVRGSTLGSGVVLSGAEVEITPDMLADLEPHYGALGHIHQYQEVAPKSYYVGSPWNTSHSSKPSPERYYQIVDVADGNTYIEQIATTHRKFVTLEFEWDGFNLQLPDLPAIEGKVEYRLRIRTLAENADTLPLADAISYVSKAEDVTIKVEKIIKPRHRVRLPELQKTQTIQEKIQCYWGALLEEPTPEQQAAALKALVEIEASITEEGSCLLNA